MKRIFILGFITLLAFPVIAIAQKPPFYEEIEQFKKEDSISFPPKNAILFVGSSSFRVWKSMQADFPGYTIINRGFGGSHLPEVTRYVNDIIVPYHPKQILIYCGDNDLAESDSVTATVVLRRFAELFNSIRTQLPNTPIAFVSIKPSPSRSKLMPRMVKANLLVKNFLRSKKRTAFIDIYHPMLDRSGQPRQELFTSDNLHMNEKGYAIWKRVIQPYLLK